MLKYDMDTYVSFLQHYETKQWLVNFVGPLDQMIQAGSKHEKLIRSSHPVMEVCKISPKADFYDINLSVVSNGEFYHIKGYELEFHSRYKCPVWN